MMEADSLNTIVIALQKTGHFDSVDGKAFNIDGAPHEYEITVRNGDYFALVKLKVDEIKAFKEKRPEASVPDALCQMLLQTIKQKSAVDRAKTRNGTI